MPALEAKQNKTPRRRLPLVVAAVLAVALLLVVGPVRAWVEENGYPLQYTEEVERWAAEYDVDPYLVYAVIRTESGFRPEAQSSVGARGLMQMTGDTFEWLKGRLEPGSSLTFDDLYTPAVSIRYGAYLLSLSLARYGGDVATAAAAYHSGWGTVDRLLAEGKHTKDGTALSSFPFNQMRHYVYKVQNSYQRYKAIYAS